MTNGKGPAYRAKLEELTKVFMASLLANPAYVKEDNEGRTYTSVDFQATAIEQANDTLEALAALNAEEGK